jgi:mRNA interferase MazF
MTQHSGDVVLVRYPFSAGQGAKVRPAVIIQSDHNNVRLPNTIIAQLTTNTSRTHESTQVLVDPATPEGQSSGLRAPSAVTCENLVTIHESLISRTIGRLSDPLMRQVNAALKASLALP